MAAKRKNYVEQSSRNKVGSDQAAIDYLTNTDFVNGEFVVSVKSAAEGKTPLIEETDDYVKERKSENRTDIRVKKGLVVEGSVPPPSAQNAVPDKLSLATDVAEIVSKQGPRPPQGAPITPEAIARGFGAVGDLMEGYGAYRAGREKERYFGELAAAEREGAEQDTKQIQEDRAHDRADETLRATGTGVFSGKDSFEGGTAIEKLMKHNDNRANELAERITARAEKTAARYDREGREAKRAGTRKAVGSAIEAGVKIFGGL